ncbi:MAG: NfeD family protein [Acholeplasma sp.]|nr:MAG: NfeD family protein [Acholeplasma sp.]
MIFPNPISIKSRFGHHTVASQIKRLLKKFRNCLVSILTRNQRNIKLPGRAKINFWWLIWRRKSNMLEYMVWFWLGLFVIAFVLEIFTADMISIWFAIAAIPSFIIALAGGDIIFQSVSFVVFTLVLLLLTRPVVKKYLKTNEIKTNVDAMVGMTGKVIKEITPNDTGRILIRALDWAAVSKEVITVGEMARVLDVEGNKLIVEKIEK